MVEPTVQNDSTAGHQPHADLALPVLLIPHREPCAIAAQLHRADPNPPCSAP